MLAPIAAQLEAKADKHEAHNEGKKAPRVWVGVGYSSGFH